MKDEYVRIMKLVKEGKLSPEDAAELMEAFRDAPDEPEETEEPVAAGVGGGQESAAAEGKREAKPGDPFSSLIGAIEGLAKDVTKNIDWQSIGDNVRQGVSSGVDAIKKAAEEAKLGKGFGFLFGPQESKIVELPLSVPEGKILRVEGSAASVSVVGGGDLGQIRVTAGFRAGSAEEAKEKAALYTPVVEENDQYITLKLQDTPDSRVDAALNVPPGTAVEIRTASGNASVRALSGSVKVQGASADFEGRGLTGSLDVILASGDASLKESTVSMASIETKSGEIFIGKVEGSINARTSSGNVVMSEVSGRTISVDAASGDVSLDLVKPIEGNVSVRAVSGDVSVGITDGSDALVSLSTLQGDARQEVSLLDLQEMSGKLSGRLGHGTGQIDLSTVSGDVYLFLRDAVVAESEEKAEAAPSEGDPDQGAGI